MDVTISRPVKKIMLGIILAAAIPLFAMHLYVEGYYHYLRAKLSLYNAGVETTELWQVSDTFGYCGKDKKGGWVVVLDVIYTGQIAEDACIENVE